MIHDPSRGAPTTGDHSTALGPGREFDAIRALVAQWGSAASGIGDDAAVLSLAPSEQLVVSTDTSVEGVHFRRAWLSAEEIGWRATMAALSDLAAMGARPLGVLLALTVPDEWRAALPALGAGVGEAVRAARTVIVGGDTTRGGELALGITVLGAATRPLRRVGAQPGDAVYLTGAVGGPGLALAAWEAGAEPAAADRARFARPEARLAAGRWLAEHGATAAIDLSDGLVADAAHVAAASGVGLTLDGPSVPAVPGATLAQALASGEEYELLCTAPATLSAEAFARAVGLPLTRIGTVHAGPSAVLVLDENGQRVEFTGGHDHFSV
jgi:thiamine-monophosphate kinase